MTLQAQQAELVEESAQTSDEPLELTLESDTDDDQHAAASQTQQSDAPASAAAAEDTLTGDDIPEKYRDKSTRELLDILRANEEYVGRQANELGQLRQQVGTLRGVVDQAIAVTAGEQPSRNTGDESAELSADDLLTNPGEAIGKGVAKYLKPLEERLSALDARDREAEFVKRHPTAPNDLNDEKFVEFVKGSAYRQRLAQRAFSDPKNVDYDAAEELWLGYEETVAASTSAATDPADAEPAETHKPNAPSAKDVALVRSGGSGGADSAADKTIYSAQALTRLQMEDPDKYYDEAFYNKIAKAFAEGRVK